jgi:hypothetical protein
MKYSDFKKDWISEFDNLEVVYCDLDQTIVEPLSLGKEEEERILEFIENYVIKQYNRYILEMVQDRVDDEVIGSFNRNGLNPKEQRTRLNKVINDLSIK